MKTTINRFIACALVLVTATDAAAEPTTNAHPAWALHNITRSPERQEGGPVPALKQHVLRHDLKSGKNDIFGPLEPTARPFPTTLPPNRVFGDYAGISAAGGKVIATFSSNCPDIAGVKNPSAAGDVGVAVFDFGGK